MQLGSQFCSLVMTGVAVIVIDRLGRRPLLLGGVSGMMISLFLLGSYYIFYNTVPAVAVVALLLYVGCYQLSFGPIGWLMISEIFPLKLRGRGISIAVLVNFGTNALVTFAFLPLKCLSSSYTSLCLRQRVLLLKRLKPNVSKQGELILAPPSLLHHCLRLWMANAVTRGGVAIYQGISLAAIKSLRRLRGSVVVDSAAEQVNEILAELSSVGEDKEATLGELFQGKCLKALTIAGGLVLLQQITGQPSVLYYAPSILQTAGFSAATDATRISILLGLLKLVMTGVAVIVIDRLGRRPLLLGGVSGMMISLLLLGSYYIFYNTVPAVAVVALLLYVGCYQLSFGPIGWLMISEIFPLKLRGRGISIAVLVNFGTNALVTFAFSPLKELLGAGVLFCGFGVICVVSLFFIYFIVPETKGLTLEEIEAKCL
ncbi:hypothetical protein F2Q70_00024083 [Brassica cretica]|uniref:Major facilitator superfamily (MFS) profile domain-containing protein n=1 Tax=Brassica cretica TaxID=69181 RepID=A0A8S9GXM7_BRACR|nr:hypothetical protein F2Q70_00024083 [Brassica cretica]